MDFVKKNIEAMDKEFNFWIENRTTSITREGQEFRLARYDVEVDAPRPGNFSLNYAKRANS